MNNEPVAWMVDGEVYLLNEIDGEELNAIPLYTHPSKDLTDEEILKEARESADYWMNHFDRHSKADREILYRHVADKFRAILRKAGEK